MIFFCGFNIIIKEQSQFAMFPGKTLNTFRPPKLKTLSDLVALWNNLHNHFTWLMYITDEPNKIA